jgi:hypothetical protein
LSLSLSSRASGLLLGQVAAAGPGQSPAGASLRLALSRTLAEVLLVPDPDLSALALRWAAEAQPGAPLDGGSLAGFASLRDRGVPRTAAQPGEQATLPLHLLPVALVAFDTPRTLTSLTWHLAVLTHPDPDSTWGAVAVNVAAARLLQGHRDFVPDVIEALRNNAAPTLLLETVRRLPLLRRETIDGLAGSTSPAIGATCAALWAAHTEPRTSAAVEWLERLPGQVAASAAAAGAGLLGARDGIEALRIALGERGVDLKALKRLAEQLARIAAPDGRA